MEADATAALVIALRSAAGLLFLEAGLGKLAHGARFEGVVANYEILPGRLVGVVARGLPAAELALAAALLTAPGLDALAPWSALAGAALLAVFAAAMGVNLLRGRSAIDCGCGRGGLRQPLSWGRVGRNLGLAGLLAASAAAGTAASWTAWALGLAAGAGIFVLDYALAHLGAAAPARPAGDAR
jgi:hypothetical protein